MPFYEYSCSACGEVFEVLQKIGSGGEEVQCPKCGAIGGKKLMSLAAVHGTTGGSSGGASGGCSPHGGFT